MEATRTPSSPRTGTADTCTSTAPLAAVAGKVAADLVGLDDAAVLDADGPPGPGDDWQVMDAAGR